MLKTIVSSGRKITYMAAKDDVALRRYKRKIFRLVLGTKTEHGKTREICMLPPIV
jgi:hypothetical protein